MSTGFSLSRAAVLAAEQHLQHAGREDRGLYSNFLSVG